MAKAGNGPRRTGLRLALALAVLGAAVAPGGPSAAQQPQIPAARPAVPVSVSKVMRQDVPIWVRELGTVQAFYSVQLRPKVDGTLLQVPVSEGQEVKQGDLLAIIDPKPYQAVLDAATAKKLQDQADLANAKRDLERYNSLAKQDFASHQQVDTQAALVNHMIAVLAADDARPAAVAESPDIVGHTIWQYRHG